MLPSPSLTFSHVKKVCTHNLRHKNKKVRKGEGEPGNGASTMVECHIILNFELPKESKDVPVVVTAPPVDRKQS